MDSGLRTSPGGAVEAAPLVIGHGAQIPGHLLLREHGLAGWLLWLTTEGTGLIVHSSGTYGTAPGELILIRPQVRQHYGGSPEGEWVCWWAVFHPRGHWHPLLQWPEISPGIMHFRPQDCARHLELFAQGYEATRGPQKRRLELGMAYLETLLLHCETDASGTETDARVLSAIEFLCSRQDDPTWHPSLEQIARAAGVSIPHLCRLFLSQVGVPPVRYLEQRRLERAADLIRVSTLRVGEVAAASGFNDPLYFSTRFRKHTGLSPRDYARVSRET